MKKRVSRIQGSVNKQVGRNCQRVCEKPDTAAVPLKLSLHLAKIWHYGGSCSCTLEGAIVTSDLGSKSWACERLDKYDWDELPLKLLFSSKFSSNFAGSSLTDTWNSTWTQNESQMLWIKPYPWSNFLLTLTLIWTRNSVGKTGPSTWWSSGWRIQSTKVGLNEVIPIRG